jgi:hypothetical protein
LNPYTAGKEDRTKHQRRRRWPKAGRRGTPPG